MSGPVAAPRVVDAAACERAVSEPELIDEIARGFVAYTEQHVVVPPVGHLALTDPPGDVHIKYGYVRGGDVFVVKVASGFPGNSNLGLPTGDGCMLVFSCHTGLLEAVLLDRSRLTDIRTAAAGAVAARALAPRTISRIGVIGTGVQARLQPRLLRHVTTCREIALYGRSRERAAACAADLTAAGFRVERCTSADDVVQCSDLIVTTTASREPLFHASSVHPGSLIIAVGADAPGKVELDPALFARASVVVADSIAQCADHGDLAPALAARTISLDRVHELGAVLADPALGRTREDEIAIADLTGVAVQDIVIAEHVLRRLSETAA